MLVPILCDALMNRFGFLEKFRHVLELCEGVFYLLLLNFEFLLCHLKVIHDFGLIDVGVIVHLMSHVSIPLLEQIVVLGNWLRTGRLPHELLKLSLCISELNLVVTYHEIENIFLKWTELEVLDVCV